MNKHEFWAGILYRPCLLNDKERKIIIPIGIETRVVTSLMSAILGGMETEYLIYLDITESIKNSRCIIEKVFTTPEVASYMISPIEEPSIVNKYFDKFRKFIVDENEKILERIDHLVMVTCALEHSESLSDAIDDGDDEETIFDMEISGIVNEKVTITPDQLKAIIDILISNATDNIDVDLNDQDNLKAIHSKIVYELLETLPNTVKADINFTVEDLASLITKMREDNDD